MGKKKGRQQGNAPASGDAGAGGDAPSGQPRPEKHESNPSTSQDRGGGDAQHRQQKQQRRPPQSREQQGSHHQEQRGSMKNQQSQRQHQGLLQSQQSQQERQQWGPLKAQQQGHQQGEQSQPQRQQGDPQQSRQSQQQQQRGPPQGQQQQQRGPPQGQQHQQRGPQQDQQPHQQRQPWRQQLGQQPQDQQRNPQRQPWGQQQSQQQGQQPQQQKQEQGPRQGQQPHLQRQPWGQQQSQQQGQQPKQQQQEQGPQQGQQRQSWGPQRGPAQRQQPQRGPEQRQQPQRGPPQGQQPQRGPPPGQQPQQGPPQGQQPHQQQLQLEQQQDPKPHQTTQAAFRPQSRASSVKSVESEGLRTLQKSTPRSIMSLTEQLEKDISLAPKKEVIPGTKGRKISIETNHLTLDLGKLKTAYHYDVNIDPDIPKKFLRNVFEEFRRIHFPNRNPAFDGRKNMYSPFKLVKDGEELSDEITILDPVNNREKKFKVAVKLVNEVDLSPLHNMKMTLYSPQEAIQCVEIVLRSAPSARCIQAGRSFFTQPANIIDLGEGMEMYQGFYQSVVRGWKPLLNIDVAHKAFPKEMNIIDLIIDLFSTFRQKLSADELTKRQLYEYEIKSLNKFLRTLRIVYEIRGQPGSKREYRVNGVDVCPREKRFSPDNGPEMTIEEYFSRKKNHRLRFPLMPTIWVGNMQRTDRILLPAELCTILPGQAVNRKMTENQTSAMIKRAATSTTIRKDKIMNSLYNTSHNRSPCIKEFGFTLGDQFEQIQARVLMPPELGYINGKITPSRGVWRQDNIEFFKGAEISNWTIVSACGQLDNLNSLADMIYKFARPCGMNMTSRAKEPFHTMRGRQANPREIFEVFDRCKKSKIELIFVVIPDSGPTYSDVKKAAEISVGCLTQCIKRKTMYKLNPSTVNNILLKVNSKLNGTNHYLFRTPRVLQKPCMMMGADVTHPSPDSQNVPSVAAVTASHDPKAFCYNITCRLQSPREEIIVDLREITKEHLLKFYQMNRQQKPQRIIFFRDGVSEGQFPIVINRELTAIRSACSSLEQDYQPQITFLVVQKRHHTRFFPKNPRDSEDKNMNVPAGTCVDTVITNPMIQDFYLVSHASIQGVAKPTKYCTLWDDNDMSNDEIEELTYHLCHLFTRCNRSVSYPAPTYYAHLAAARAKVYIENDNINLNNLEGEKRKIAVLDVIRKDRPMFFV